MSSVDERVVKMTFDNAQFQKGIQDTIRSLEALNKSLQMIGISKGLVEFATVSQQFDKNVARNRDSMGRFAQGVTEVSTASQQLDHNVSQNRDSMGRFTKSTTDASVSSHSLGEKVEQARDSMGRFTQGVHEASSASNEQKGSLKGVENGIRALTDRFSTMNVIGTASLVSLTQRAVEAGKQFVKSFTVDPVLSGFHEYETQINAVQTILANTQAAGTNLHDVNHALDELNHYADQTIYNFAEMAKNIGTFTAAGVGLKESTAAIKGIANLAALSGSNSEQASGAMYQLSQAISAGRVSLEDWNSVVNAGMGGTVFQRALAQTAVKMGTLSEGAVKLKGKMKNVTIEGKSFRESITAKPGEESWLTSKVLTNTLAQFTGDLSDAELKAQGFNKAEIKAIQAQAKMAKNAATEVKTLSQLFDTFRESVSSGWSQTFEIIFGDFNEAKGLFTGISNTVGAYLSATSARRNKILSDWKQLGGRKQLIDGITNSVKALASFLKPIGDAFRQIFPATTGKQLFELTERFANFTAKLKIGSETATNLKRTFAGVFAIFGIGIDIIKGVVGVIFDLLGMATKGSGGFLEFTAKVGDFIVRLREAIKNGDDLGKFFGTLTKILALPLKIIGAVAKGLGNLFSQINVEGILKKLAGFLSIFKPIGSIIDELVSGGDKVVELINKMFAGFAPLVKMVGGFFKTIASSIEGAFDGIDYGKILGAINTGLFAGLVLLVKKVVDNFTGGGGAGGPGIVDVIKDTIGQLTDTMKAMQNALNAATLLQIAIAIGILAISVIELSKVNTENLGKALGAITVMFTQLIGALAVFNKFIGTSGFAKLPFVMGSLILLAIAVDVLVIAVKQLASLDWNSLAKGMTGLIVMLGALVATVKLMPPSQGLVSTGLGLIIMAGAVKILASAVSDLSGMSWEGMAKGLVGVGAILGSLILFTKFSQANKDGVLQGAGILLLAAGIKILASALKDLSGLSWSEIGKGLAAMAGGLAIISAALYAIPPTAILGSAGVLVVALSLGMIGKALEQMGEMSWGEIGKGLTAMLGAFTIIAAALYVIPPTAVLGAAGVLVVALSLGMITKVLQKMASMSWEEIGKAMTVLSGSLILIAGAMLAMIVALPGAAALLVVAASLAVLTPILVVFGQMSWTEIVKGLTMLAGVFVVLGAAGIVLAPIVPVLLGLGAAIALLGVGVLAAGAGVLLFATALTALAAAGTAGTAAIVAMVTGLLGLIPEVMKQLGLGIVAFAQVIATAGPAITKAIVVVIGALIEAIVILTPKVVKTLLSMLTMMIQQMSNYIPKMVSAGLKLVTGILNGIAQNLGGLITAAAKVVIAFLNGIANNLPKVANAGANLVIKFINTVANTIRSHSAELGAAGVNLATAIIEGMVRGLAGGLGQVISKAKDVASSAINAAKSVLGIHSPSKAFEKIGNYVNDGFRKGLDGNKSQVDTAFNKLKDMLKDLSKNAKASAAERQKAASAYSTLTKKLEDEHSTLGKLANKYDEYTQKIKDAQQALTDIKKTRDDYKKSITDQYSVLPDISSDSASLKDYEEDLKTRIEKTKQFANTLQRLRDIGLNDEAYKQLLAKGIDALPFANELLAGGKASVDEINNLDSQLATAAAALGKSASSELYDAAVHSAEGLVKGLQLQQSRIEQQMDKIADAMVAAIKRKLGIKSPSRAFMEIGGYSAEGLAKGLVDMSGIVEKSAAATGQTAIESLRKSISGFSDLITQDVELNPTITPVLDLSSVKKDASQIDSFFSGQPVSVDYAYAKAKAISDSRSTTQDTDATTPQKVATSYVYNQYNNSPKALSTAEIYRRTKNQLSVAKGALDSN